MRAVVCHEAKLTVEETEPPVPGPGQVLVDVVRAGICGSDLHASRHGDVLADAAAKIGIDDLARPHQRIVFGHEFAGRVAAYGPGCKGEWPVGTLVSALPMVRQLDRVRLTGLSELAPGAYAEQVVTQEIMTEPVPDSLDASVAAMTEPMAVALHAVNKSRISRRETAVVIGCGPIGLAVIVMLKARGVAHVVASDFSALRRDLARQCGADLVLDPAAESPWASFGDSSYYTQAPALLDYAFDTTEQLRRLPLVPWKRVIRAADRLGFAPKGPVVFECVGVPGILEHIIDSAPLYSRVVVVGVCMQPDTISPSMGINKEIALQFVFAYDPAEFFQTLALMGRGKVDPRPLHTGTIGLDGVAQAFQELASAQHHAKILIDPAQR